MPNKVNILVILLIIELMTAAVITYSDFDDFEEYTETEVDELQHDNGELREILFSPRARRQRRKQHRG